MNHLNFTTPRRVMVNQPSTLQPYNNLHGRYAIAVPDLTDTRDCEYTTIYFTDGPVHSQRIAKSALAVSKLSSAEDR